MLFVICILCAALALWLAATLFLWHRELLEIQKALEDIGAGNLNRRIVTRGPQAIRSIGYGINKIVQQSQQSAIQQKRHEQAYKQLITNLSHDIKTPLASLTGYLEAVENGLVVGQEKEEYLQTAYERAGALRSFVEKLFEWVKLDAGEQKLQIEPLDLCEISRQYMAEWIGPLESSGFSYTIEIPEETWLADLDKNAYKRIVNNLCENVLRHSHGTQFRFCLIPDARQATIRVSDNGTGISADDLPHVLTGYINAILPAQPPETVLAFPLPRNWSLLWAAPFRYKVFRTTKRHSPSVFRKQKRCHKATLFLPSGISLTGVFPSTPQTAVVPLPTGKTPGSWAAGTGRSAPAPAGVRRPPGS